MLRRLPSFPTRPIAMLARATLAGIGVAIAAVARPVAAQTALSPPAPRTITLHDVLDSALTRHPLSQAAGARVNAARGARTTAGAIGNPVLSYDVENAPFPGGDPIVGMARETMATATVPLASIVQRFPRARRADAEVRAAEADARLARQQLALDASRAFFRTALAQVSVDAANDLTAWLDSVVAYNK